MRGAKDDRYRVGVAVFCALVGTQCVDGRGQRIPPTRSVSEPDAPPSAWANTPWPATPPCTAYSEVTFEVCVAAPDQACTERNCSFGCTGEPLEVTWGTSAGRARRFVVDRGSRPQPVPFRSGPATDRFTQVNVAGYPRERRRVSIQLRCAESAEAGVEWRCDREGCGVTATYADAHAPLGPWALSPELESAIGRPIGPDRSVEPSLRRAFSRYVGNTARRVDSWMADACGEARCAPGVEHERAALHRFVSASSRPTVSVESSSVLNDEHAPAGYRHWHVDAEADGESVSMEIDEAGIRLRFGQFDCDETGCHEGGEGFLGEVIRFDHVRAGDLTPRLTIRTPMLNVTGL